VGIAPGLFRGSFVVWPVAFSPVRQRLLNAGPLFVRDQILSETPHLAESRVVPATLQKFDPAALPIPRESFGSKITFKGVVKEGNGLTTPPSIVRSGNRVERV
jgi:hypothetical protein